MARAGHHWKLPLGAMSGSLGKGVLDSGWAGLDPGTQSLSAVRGSFYGPNLGSRSSSPAQTPVQGPHPEPAQESPQA